MNGIMIAFLIMLGLCLLFVAYVALRRPVVFKMGMRNIPRRRTQTALIIIGLMLSTAISTAALGMGDTINRSLTAATYNALGEVDQLVVFSQEPRDASFNSALTTRIPAESLQIVEEAVADDPNVEGVIPALLEFVPAINIRTEQTTPVVFFVGIDPERVETFGGLQSIGGQALDLGALGDNEVIVSETTASEIDAEAGDTVVVFLGNQPRELTVHAVAENSPLSGVLNITNPGMVVSLDWLQDATGQEGLLSFIGISNVGGVRDGVERTDAVVDALAPRLEGTQLGIDPIKQTNVELSELASSGLTGLFLVLGLFSIAVGVLLIILIFSMLAAERRSEMGMARAVGQQRGQLIQQFIAEGAGYALLAGLVGAAAGVGVTFALGAFLGGLVGDFFEVETLVTPRSAIVGYSLGVIITFLAIVVASWRASRLNVVAAIRDLPDESNPKRRLRTLVWASLLLVVGGLLSLVGSNTENAFSFFGGMSLIPFGIAMFARYFGAPSRPVFTVVGAYILILWLDPGQWTVEVFGSFDGGFEMFFLSGIFMVAAATLIIVQNLDVLMALVSRLGGVFQTRLPAIRMALAYPGADKSRTGLTLAMFSLIVFSLVAFATISENFARIFLSDDAGGGWEARIEVQSQNPIPNNDLIAVLQTNGVDTSDIQAYSFSESAAFQAGIRQLTIPNSDRTPDQDWSGVPLVGWTPEFVEETDLRFQQRAEGYASNQAVVEALLNEPNVAVIDPSAIDTQGGFGGDFGFQLEGLRGTDAIFPAIEVEMRNPSGENVTWRIIGILDSDLSLFFGLFANQEQVAELYPNPQSTTYWVRYADGVDTTARTADLQAALITHGAEGASVAEILEEGQAQFSGFLIMIQGFMGLGMIVGIAAVGVIAFRAVVERRQQIGMLRAIGYQRSMVSLSFMIETVFVVSLGVISGTLLALALAYQLFQDEAFTGGIGATTFVVPWGLVVGILVVAFGMALLMTWVPSQQASKIQPAEALRYE